MSLPARALIHSARLVSGGTLTPEAWVTFENGAVAAVGTGSSWRALGIDEVQTTDAAGRLLTPGFIDIHCHGAGGAAFDDGTEAIRTALAVHHRHGTTRAVLSLVTAGQADLEGRLAVVSAEAERNPLVLGAHLEGPFLDATFRGAHDPALLRSPDPEGVERLLAVGRGQIRQVTLAPELPGAADALARFVAAGVSVAVGHSAADYDTARAAFDAGATILTHAFNGMKGIHHRAPGPVAAAMDSPGVTLEVINDGVHVHPSVVRLAFAGSPGRIALVTDAMAATGASDGCYVLGSLAVQVTDGVARLVDGGAIAGSTLTLDAALRNAVAAGVALPDAVTALTETPARAIGRGHDLGRLSVGYAADAVLLGPDLTVDAVFAAGRPLPRSPSTALPEA
ncbi:N-acetylglucosamine-6-phosphate deacetylase [Cryobacterium roopkundense]|uniref:N-acetylglucosamine-6-phosphate deacetylase n=1 Tax=Cryobacterium roopkundense TaxID=1001240 RepID=A0A099J267_9MICO|nr:N-acetylglucosamine-6-phosphate deacetylase [Cryobacterium roopkundense]KGJ72381.1 N-acetylglucosamine-6-phosphate deacetylase [Cryobacterium roopkundense]MBB5642345.1 N-acetylglucosamine-6-phosphate deacetylase [Cryobacterium roopkundense]